MADDRVLRDIAELLRSRTPHKPWMTATGLARELCASTGRTLSPTAIERILVAHARTAPRAVRYSHYPSKATLDILWGHVDIVGERENLAELDRIDDPYCAPCPNIAPHAPWFFISHNHRDLAQVLELRRLITDRHCGTWLFEAEIPTGGQIAPLVAVAIGECEYFLSYVTRRSLGSLWVQKEIEVARQRGDCKTVVVVDGRDPELLELFEEWTGEWPFNRESLQKFYAAAAKDGSTGGRIWEQRCETFMTSLNEYMGGTNRLLSYPALAERRWRGRRLSVQSFEQFLRAETLRT